MQLGVRRRPRGELVARNPQTPNICLFIVPFPALNNLGRHPKRCSGKCLPPRAESVRHLPADAEIRQTGLASLRQQHVRRLYIAMNLPFRVQILQRMQNITYNTSNLAFIESTHVIVRFTLIRDVPRASARHVLHHNRQLTRALHER